MKKNFRMLIVIACFVPASLFAQLDNTFDHDGRASVAVGVSSSERAMLIQPMDQKIVVAGEYSDGTNLYYCLARFLPTGEPDTLFGTAGVLKLPFNNQIEGTAKIGLQSNGSIILAGEFFLANNQRAAIVVRITSLGQIDYSFSATGYIEIFRPSQVASLLIQSDDKILVGGYDGGIAVIRLTKDGLADPSFGSGGEYLLGGNYQQTELHAMASEVDGSIVIAAGSGNVIVLHLSRNGVFDTHFGTKGIFTLTVDGNDPVYIQAITVVSNGDIVLTGDYTPNVKNPLEKYLVVRLSSLGVLNPLFAGNGKLGIPFVNDIAYGYGTIEIQDGYLMVVGYVYPQNGGVAKVGMCRVTGNGAIDNGFGTNGVEITAWTPNTVDVQGISIALQKDQKIVVGASLSGNGLAVLRYNDPVILPPPPVVNARLAAVQQDAGNSIKARIQISPNPASQTLYIRGLDTDSATMLQVFDPLGHALITASSTHVSTYSLDINNLAAGMYYLTLSKGPKRQNFSFIKLR